MTARLSGFSGRGAGTDAERRAAAWLHDDLRARGHEAWVETHWVRPQWPVPIAIATLLGVIGSLVSVAVPIAGVALAGVGALCLGLEAAGWPDPLRLALPRRATQHVITVPPDPERTTLVICARYDAPRRGLVLNDRWRRFGVLARSPRGWLALACAVVAGAAGARLAGVQEATWLGAVQLLPTVVLLVSLAAAVDIALSGWAPGAGDNASGVAVALALHEEVTRVPPGALSPALLLLGAGAAGPQSLRAHVRGERLKADRAVLLELGPCAAGTPAWRSRHRQVARAAGRAAAALGVPAPAHRPKAPAARRLPAVGVACLDARGLAPRAHQGDDTPESVDPAAGERALDLALGIVDALDAEVKAR